MNSWRKYASWIRSLLLLCLCIGPAASVSAQEEYVEKSDSAGMSQMKKVRTWRKWKPFYVQEKEKEQAMSSEPREKEDDYLFLRAGLGKSFTNYGDPRSSYFLGVGRKFFIGENQYWYFQPSFELSYQQLEVEDYSYWYVWENEATFRQYCASIPVLFVWHGHGRGNIALDIGLGPYLSYGFAGKVYADTDIIWLSGKNVANHPETFGSRIGMNRWNMGLRLELSVVTRRFGFGYNFNFGLSKLWPDERSHASLYYHCYNCSQWFSFTYHFNMK